MYKSCIFEYVLCSALGGNKPYRHHIQRKFCCQEYCNVNINHSNSKNKFGSINGKANILQTLTCICLLGMKLLK